MALTEKSLPVVSSAIHIAIVEDHISVAEAYEALCTKFGFTVDFLATNGKLLLDELPNHPHTQLILMDISMPVMDGVQATQWLSDHRPEIAVIALTGYDDDKNLCDMIHAGTRGYILKPERSAIIAHAIREVMEHGYYISALFSKGMKMNSSMRAGKNEPDFTPREEEFILLCCTNLRYREIADKMGISPRTVEGHRSDVFSKLDVGTRAGILLFALETGRYSVPIGRKKTNYDYDRGGHASNYAG